MIDTRQNVYTIKTIFHGKVLVNEQRYYVQDAAKLLQQQEDWMLQMILNKEPINDEPIDSFEMYFFLNDKLLESHTYSKDEVTQFILDNREMETCPHCGTSHEVGHDWSDHVCER